MHFRNDAQKSLLLSLATRTTIINRDGSTSNLVLTRNIQVVCHFLLCCVVPHMEICWRTWDLLQSVCFDRDCPVFLLMSLPNTLVTNFSLKPGRCTASAYLLLQLYFFPQGLADADSHHDVHHQVSHLPDFQVFMKTQESFYRHGNLGRKFFLA